MSDVKTERWAIVMQDGYSFDIIPARGQVWDNPMRGDELVNGTYDSKLAAVERLIDDLERNRAATSAAISRAKRMRSRLRAQTL